MAASATLPIQRICMRRSALLLMAVHLMCAVTTAEIAATPAAKQYAQDYTYRYAVDAASTKGAVTDRWEERRGGAVRGAYSLLQPDGMVRSVDYEVGAASERIGRKSKSGFQAVVRYWPGPQNLLSVMSLSDMMAEHAHPPVNSMALWGKEYDVKQPERLRQSAEMFASLRAELNQNKIVRRSLPGPSQH